MRRWTLLGLLALAVAMLTWSLLGSAEIRAIERQLRRASVAVGQRTALRPRVDEFVAARLVLDVEGAIRTLSLREVEAAINQYVARGPRLHEIQDLEVVVESPNARATGTLVISESQAGDLHAEERPFEVWLVRSDRWRIDRLTLESARKHIPEARP